MLILTLAFLGGMVAAPGSGQSQEETTFSSNQIRRDLGEKGLIVIESLELNEADLADVVRLLARIAGINIITGDIRGSITVYLENVTVQSALQAILSSQGYGFIYDGNIVRVVDASQLGEDRVQTVTEIFQLNYLPAAAVADNLRKVFSGNQSGASLSQVEANIEANAIIVVDIPRRIEDIRRLIKVLDVRFEQVEIEGRFVEISWNQDQEYGLDWKYFQDPANTFDVNLSPQALNSAGAAGQFKFAVISGSHNLTGFIQALETNNDIRILANPKILALENKEALIELTDEIPFVEANVSQGVITESVQFQETGIRLVVTPQIAQEHDGAFIRMDLELEQRIPGPNVVLQNSIAFPVDSRRAQTELIVPDESTVIIGGLRSNDKNFTYEKIPVLGNIPFFGLPFRRRAKTDDQTELLLFVTPRVIYDHPALDCKEQELHDKIEETNDALETQAKWREVVESPFEAFEKHVQYSGVNSKPEKYVESMATLDAIEGVKPYRVSKPKGERRYRISVDGKVIREEVLEPEEVPAEEFDASGQPIQTEPNTVTNEDVRSFKEIEVEAKPATAPSEAGWFNPDRANEAESAPGFPPPPPPMPLDIPSESPAENPESLPEPSGSKENGGAPNWLRRGANRASDAGDASYSLDEEPVFEAAEEPPVQSSEAALAPQEGFTLPTMEIESSVEAVSDKLPVPEVASSSPPIPPPPIPVAEPSNEPVPLELEEAIVQAMPEIEPAPEPPIASIPPTGSVDPWAGPGPASTPPVQAAEVAPVQAPPSVTPPPAQPAAEDPRLIASRMLSEMESAARKRSPQGGIPREEKLKALTIPVPEIAVEEKKPAPPKKAEIIGAPVVPMPPLPTIPKARGPVGPPIGKATPKIEDPVAPSPVRPVQKQIVDRLPMDIQVVDLTTSVKKNATAPDLTKLLDPETRTALAEAEHLEKMGSAHADARGPLPINEGFTLPVPQEAVSAAGTFAFFANSPNPRPILFSEEEGVIPQAGPEGFMDTPSAIAYHEEDDKSKVSDKEGESGSWWGSWIGSE